MIVSLSWTVVMWPGGGRARSGSSPSYCGDSGYNHDKMLKECRLSYRMRGGGVAEPLGRTPSTESTPMQTLVTSNAMLSLTSPPGGTPAQTQMSRDQPQPNIYLQTWRRWQLEGYIYIGSNVPFSGLENNTRVPLIVKIIYQHSRHDYFKRIFRTWIIFCISYGCPYHGLIWSSEIKSRSSFAMQIKTPFRTAACVQRV